MTTPTPQQTAGAIMSIGLTIMLVGFCILGGLCLLAVV